MTLAPGWKSCLTWTAVALAIRAGLNLAVRSAGFSAISDDDFARVAIAQAFSQNPHVDASGTSWLPFPFWLTGTVMRWTEPTWEVAQHLAWGTSLASVLMFCFCAHATGLRARWLGLATCGYAALPHAVWLGLAPVPEGYTPVLALAGLCTVRSFERGEKVAAWVGGAALLAATLSRYETWPLAVVAAAYHAASSKSRSTWQTCGLLLLSLGGPMAWLVHGLVNHNDAFFFVQRVASYRRALGVSSGTWLTTLGNYPLSLMTEEFPLFALGGALALFEATRRLARRTSHPPAEFVRAPLCWGATALMGFLVWGDLTNGAPTHHPERALLSAWLVIWLCVVQTARGLTTEYRTHWRGGNLLRGATFGAATALACLMLASGLFRQTRQEFVDRSKELAVGKRWGTELTHQRRWFVETEGYGYIAVSVGTERPWLVTGRNPEDPRQRAGGPPWSDPGDLRRYFSEHQVHLVMAPGIRSAPLSAIGTPLASLGPSVLFELGGDPPRGN